MERWNFSLDDFFNNIDKNILLGFSENYNKILSIIENYINDENYSFINNNLVVAKNFYSQLSGANFSTLDYYDIRVLINSLKLLSKILSQDKNLFNTNEIFIRNLEKLII